MVVINTDKKKYVKKYFKFFFQQAETKQIHLKLCLFLNFFFSTFSQNLGLTLQKELLGVKMLDKGRNRPTLFRILFVQNSTINAPALCF